MNILVIAHYQNDGSPTAIFIHDQILAYRRLGHSVRVIVPIAFGKRGLNGRRLETGVRQEVIDGIPHYFVRHLSLSKYGEKRFNTATTLHVLRVGLRAILDGFAPDVIHAHTLGLDSELGAWLKARLGVQLVVTTHGGDTFVPYAEGRRDDLRRLASRADRLVCVSSLLKCRLEECGISVPMPVIFNGFQIKSVVSETERPPVSLIQAGSLISRKKADVTIRAFAKLSAKYPDASLDIVGSGPEAGRFQALCRELGGEARFHGALPNSETLAEMAKARFFVMPSVNEGFGIVYLEAMASGCIAIGTEGEGIADLIVSGENGFLVPPDDPDAIVRTVEWCLAHPEEAEAVAERGRRDAMGLTWEKNAAE